MMFRISQMFRADLAAEGISFYADGTVTMDVVKYDLSVEDGNE